MRINLLLIYRILGSLLFIEAFLLTGCCALSVYYGENDVFAFIISILFALLAGVVFKFKGRYAENRLSRKDGYIVVSSSWVIFSLIGMLPYLISGYIPSVTDAFFETMSGFTSTGASILNNIESLPHGLLFWRSLTQWIGGLGIVFFTIAILPSLASGGGLKLFSAEATGPLHDKLHPRVETTAHWIWTVYFTLTALTAIALFGEGMSWFDSICHSLTATSTGGMSTRQGSIADFHSPTIEYTLTLSMFLAGVNFSLLYFCIMKGKVLKLFQDTEFRFYLSTVAIFTGIVMASLMVYKGYGMEEAFRKAVFQIVSIQTTTGFATDDFMNWPLFLMPLLLAAMLLGACSGSTTGAIKCIRMAMITKLVRNEFRNIIHPNAVLPVRINQAVISSNSKSTLLAFIAMYFGILMVAWPLLMFTGMGFMESISVAISSMCNIGPGMGEFGPSNSWSELPMAAKWICSFLMLVGRLEVFSVMILFTRHFWKER